MNQILNKFNNPEKILVYGAGLTGKNLVDALIQKNKKELAIVDTYLGGKKEFYKNYEILIPEKNNVTESELILVSTPDYFVYDTIKKYLINEFNVDKQKIIGIYQGKIKL